jgi:hypothetical protein
MNLEDWLPILAVFGASAISYLLPQKLKARITEPINRRLKPIVETLFPMFRFEPWLFEPIAEADLPAWQRKHFETHTAGFLARGFTHLGDFVLRRDPQPSCSRYFLSRDCTTIGALSCYLRIQSVDCMSVLMSGMYLETANVSCSRLPPKEHGLQFFILRTDDAIELIEHHNLCVEKIAAELNSQPAPLDPADLPAVCNYGRQLALGSLHKQGMLGDLPEFLRKKTPAEAEANYSK